MNKGVNLGNWLVLEKWMSPELWAGTSAKDETHLCMELSPIAKRERFTVHRDSYITDRDFAYLAGRGIDFVRLPVPFWVFGDYEPFVGCIDYVDKAFRWADRYGVKVLVDLHTVPDSQNGFDNGGLCGVCKFHQNAEHVKFALDVLEQLTARYRDRENLWGIEVLNEPISPELWELLDVPNRYPAVDKAYAEGSEGVPTEFLKSFYTEANERIRSQSQDVRIVFHDGFRIKEWVGFFDDAFKNFVVDTHMYVMMAGTKRDLAGYESYIDETFGQTLGDMSQHFPIMVGEWNIDTKATAAADLRGQQRMDYFRKVSAAYFKALAPVVGWSYWAYKLHGDDPANDLPDAPSDVALWDMGKALELGYLPEELS